jgi:hypothetical protein
MLKGKCLILLIEEMDFLEDENEAVLVFRNETEARQYAKKRGLAGYEVVGLLNGGLSDLPLGDPA